MVDLAYHTTRTFGKSENISKSAPHTCETKYNIKMASP
jgi:hypothetical protein